MRYISSDPNKIKNACAHSEFECGFYLIIEHLITADMDDGQPLPADRRQHYLVCRAPCQQPHHVAQNFHRKFLRR